MGLVKFGQGVAKISGKVGGTVFAHNKGGTYARNFAVPTDPGSTFQNTVRQAMSALVERWGQILTQAQRDDWATYAANVTKLNRLGDPIHLPPIAWYTGCNTQRSQAGVAIADDAPTVFDRGEADSTLAVAASEATQQLSVTFDDALEWVDEDDGHLLVYASRPQSPATEFFKGPYRLAGTIDGDSVTPPTTPATMAAPFAFVEGQKIFTRLVISRADGRYSPSSFLETAAGA